MTQSPTLPNEFDPDLAQLEADLVYDPDQIPEPW